MKESFYEKKLNIETSRIETRQDNIKYYNRYEPTPYQALDLLLKKYEIKREDHFVDFGSGKGRFSFFINYYTGATCTGVELIEDFYKKSIDNLNKYRSKNYLKAQNLFFVNTYAEKYEVSKFENKFFFFNPFSKSIFIKVVNNIIKSYEEHPRPIDIVMYYPCQEYLDYLDIKTTFNHLIDIDVDCSKNIRDKISIYRMDDTIASLEDKFIIEFSCDKTCYYRIDRFKENKK
ncbi:methyltransferase [Peptostreptococcus equinus]|uniref:Methyltransferase n=1 Tax=Peptostreptococcus equinus TaxID=3003601 RepID=A0ABY7JV63_9FIRM|nr:methyltransferase [Peptostreptococcus sp. CBA3647]WAW15782.1 methyltransferase [Peptostreptococcus sp. CBA3647]